MSLTTVSAPPSTYSEAMATLGREIRPGQRQLVERGVTLQPGHHLLVKAPTATGKTLAALITAGLRHQAGLGRTIIATYTRILQDQYADKDLTDAATLFPDMRIAVLKGANNYLCRKELFWVDNDLRRHPHNNVAQRGHEHERFAVETGDPGELRRRGHLDRYRADATKCKDHDPADCGYAAAKQRARLADCVITNHTLVLLDGHGIPVLGEHDLLIIDEVHNFSRAAESFGTDEIDFAEMTKTAKTNDLIDLFTTAEKVFEPGDKYDNRVPTGTELRALAELLNTHPAGRHSDAAKLIQWCRAAIEHKSRDQHPTTMATVAKQHPRWPASKRVLLSTVIDVSVIAARGLSTTYEVPVRTGGTSGTEREMVEHERAVLMMSATTGTPERSTYVADRCGLSEVELLEVTSALDYPNQMRVSLVSDAPADWTTEHLVAKLTEHTGGRTLVLCRSWKSVNTIYDHLSRSRPGFAVLMQNSANPTLNGQVVRAFREDETSVLVGTASLFEGIDVAGPSLSQVIIVQLPGLMAFDALGQERKARAGNRWFPDHEIPATALVLEQMMGRLIRRVDDRGLVAVLDPAARRTWGATATRHAMASFGVQDIPRGQALRWFRDHAS